MTFLVYLLIIMKSQVRKALEKFTVAFPVSCLNNEGDVFDKCLSAQNTWVVQKSSKLFLMAGKAWAPGQHCQGLSQQCLCFCVPLKAVGATVAVEGRCCRRRGRCSVLPETKSYRCDSSCCAALLTWSHSAFHPLL